MLVQHGVDHVHEGLVGAPDAVTAGEQVGLEEAFALMLGELLDNLAGDGHVLVDESREVSVVPLLLGDLVGRVQTVGRGLVGPKTRNESGLFLMMSRQYAPRERGASTWPQPWPYSLTPVISY